MKIRLWILVFLICLSIINFNSIEALNPFYPNDFIVNTNNQAYWIDTTQKEVSFKFTSQNSKTLLNVSTYITGVTGSPNAKVDIYADDGTSNHYPTGSSLGTATITPIQGCYAVGSSNTPKNIWKLSPTPTLTQGSIYHIIFSCPNGNSSNKYQLRYWGATQNTYWINHTSNPVRGICTSTNGGSSWSNISPLPEPIYSLLYTDNTIEGNGYVSAPYDIDHVYGTYSGSSMKQGVMFYVPSGGITIIQAGFIIAKTSGNPNDDLYLHIASASGGASNGATVTIGTILLNVTLGIKTITSYPTNTYFGGSSSVKPIFRYANFSSLNLAEGQYVMYADSPNSNSSYYWDVLQSDGRGSNMRTLTYYDGGLTHDGDYECFIATSHTRTYLTTEFGVDLAFNMTLTTGAQQLQRSVELSLTLSLASTRIATNKRGIGLSMTSSWSNGRLSSYGRIAALNLASSWAIDRLETIKRSASLDLVTDLNASWIKLILREVSLSLTMALSGGRVANYYANIMFPLSTSWIANWPIPTVYAPINFTVMIFFFVVPLAVGLIGLKTIKFLALLCGAILIVFASYLVLNPYVSYEYYYSESTGVWAQAYETLPLHPYLEMAMIIIGVVLILAFVGVSLSGD